MAYIFAVAGYWPHLGCGVPLGLLLQLCNKRQYDNKGTGVILLIFVSLNVGGIGCCHFAR